MADYSKVWRTREVTVSLKNAGTKVILERTRGFKNKKKQIIFEHDKFLSLVQAVVHAVTVQPRGPVHARWPVAMVNGGCGTLTVSWEPYYFDTRNALMIRGGVGNCVAVEQKNAWDFALWLTRQIPVLGESSAPNWAK